MRESARCGARTRRGSPCRAPAVSGKKRCRMHGGAAGSGAPIGNQNALKDGRYTAEALQFTAEMRVLRTQMRQVHKRLRPRAIPVRYRRVLAREGYTLEAQRFVDDQMLRAQIRKRRERLLMLRAIPSSGAIAEAARHCKYQYQISMISISTSPLRRRVTGP